MFRGRLCYFLLLFFNNWLFLHFLNGLFRTSRFQRSVSERLSLMLVSRPFRTDMLILDRLWPLMRLQKMLRVSILFDFDRMRSSRLLVKLPLLVSCITIKVIIAPVLFMGVKVRANILMDLASATMGSPWNKICVRTMNSIDLVVVAKTPLIVVMITMGRVMATLL